MLHTASLLVALLLSGCADPAPSATPAGTAVAPPPASSSGTREPFALRSPEGTSPAASPAAMPAGADVDPRSLADSAFNDAMTAFETGQPTAAVLVPRAVTAYQSLPQLDSDGLFHLALLHVVGGDAKAARLTAEQILTQRPTHLLGLAVAGRAAKALGEDDAARGYAKRLLAAWDAEQGRMPEYVDHAVLLPKYREEALALVGGAAGSP